MQFGSDPQAAGITLTQPRQLVEFIRIARYPQQAAIGERRVDIVAQQPIPALVAGAARTRDCAAQLRVTGSGFSERDTAQTIGKIQLAANQHNDHMALRSEKHTSARPPIKPNSYA